MKVVACLVFLIAVTLGVVYGACEMAHFYKELGCSPEENTSGDANNDEKCPQSFSCPNRNSDTSKCSYRGVSYDDKSPIPEAVIKNPCSKACRCTIRNGVPSISCAVVDCVEVFEGELSAECVRTYSLEDCCSVGKVCGKDAVAEMKSCEFDGKSYKEGEMLYPKDSHKTCVCSAKWNGRLDGEDCRDIDCGLEIHYQDQLYKQCAPVFFDKKNRDCPITFQCPTADMKMIKGLNVRGVNAQCTFGNQTRLDVGDALDFADGTRCSCRVPPYLDCLK